MRANDPAAPRIDAGAVMNPSDPHPVRRLAIVTCFDARIDPLWAAGLQLGDAQCCLTPAPS